MPGNVVPFVGQEYTLKAFGQEWTLSRWDLDIWDPLLDWCRKVLRDPLDVAGESCHRIDMRCQDLADEIKALELLPISKRERDYEQTYVKKRKQFESWRNQQEFQTKLALVQATNYMSPDSEAVQSVIRSPRGMAHLVCILLEEHHPKITDKQAWAIVNAQPKDEMTRALQIVQGKGNPFVDVGAPDPPSLSAPNSSGTLSAGDSSKPVLDLTPVQ